MGRRDCLTPSWGGFSLQQAVFQVLLWDTGCPLRIPYHSTTPLFCSCASYTLAGVYFRVHMLTLPVISSLNMVTFALEALHDSS